jgi:hypothetical protein
MSTNTIFVVGDVDVAALVDVVGFERNWLRSGRFRAAV